MSQDKKYSLSREDIHDNDIKGHLSRINQEFADGFEFLKKYPKSVTIFGSARAKPDSDHYKDALELGTRIAKELKYAIITGGGPGIMEAVNKGAYEAGGVSIGLNISLPHERGTNAYCTHAIKFSYFFSRKTMLTFAAEAFVFFPGGYGTFDELFNILTLIQTEKIPRVPIVLFDSSFWNGFKQVMETNMVEKFGTISPKDLGFFEIADSIDHVIDIIRKAPLSEWWRNIN
ncbi:MAG: TIGR00730 family Rossman fold protein [Candidatus Paceibacterota bacterium]|jgi:hypothetical protein